PVALSSLHPAPPILAPLPYTTLFRSSASSPGAGRAGCCCPPWGAACDAIKIPHCQIGIHAGENQMNIQDVRLAVVGLGYVGLPLAVEFGKHRDVLGFDINTRRIEELRAGRDHTLEVDGPELAQATHLRYSSDPAELAAANVFIVTVPTPIDEYKQPDLTPLERASETIGRVLKRGDIVIYESTVYPGATEEVCVPVLERISGLKFNVDFYAGY